MHPRNIYKTPPDYKQLALKYPEFLKIANIDLNGTVRLNFQSKDVIRILTKCLLHADFSLEVDIPPDRLVPTVPLRLNYLLWLEDLLEADGIKNDIKGIDIGTGSCCVYPLLAAKKFNWKMLATEVDGKSLASALKNVQQNKLEDRIQIVKSELNGKLIVHCFDSSGKSFTSADFCMCNPPFFSSIDDMDNARSPARPPPRNARTGSLWEVITSGGEVAFVTKLIQESLELWGKVKIYTTMLGCKSSMKPLLKKLADAGAKHVAETKFTQGKTTRWGLAWTFMEFSNLSNQIAPKKEKTNRCLSFMVPPLESIKYLVKDVTLKVLQILKTIDIKCKVFQQKDVISTVELRAAKNTWSNQRKRRREMKNKMICESNTNDCETADGKDHLETAVTQNSENFKKDTEMCLKDSKQTSDCIISGAKRKNDDDCVVSSKIVKLENIQNNHDSSITTKSVENIDVNLNSVCSNIVTNLCLNSNSKICEDSTMNDVVSGVEDVGECSNPLSNDDVYLKAALSIRKHEDYIVLEVGYISGVGGRDGVHQVVQYIKNNWK